MRLESTPFYLYVADARRRMAEDLPEAQLIVVVRDPVDRAYSNWMHLWVDGLEPESDFVAAWRAEDERIAAGWAPFWHYRRQGRYGEQLADLIGRVGRERVLVLRYPRSGLRAGRTLNRVCSLPRHRDDQVAHIPADNSRPFVRPGCVRAVLGRVIRAGAGAGRTVAPQLWRQASRPLTAALQYRRPGEAAPPGPRAARRAGGGLPGRHRAARGRARESFDDWRSSTGRGSFARSAPELATEQILGQD